MKRRRFLKTALLPAAALSVEPLLHGIMVEGATVKSGNMKAMLNLRSCTSRTRHRSRGSEQVEEVTLTLKTPDAGELRSAKIYSADGPAYDAAVSSSPCRATIQIAKHGTASVVVARK